MSRVTVSIFTLLLAAIVLGGESKPLINVGTIGQDGHGKTTLASALNAVLSRKYGESNAISQQEDATGGVIEGCNSVEYDTSARHYENIDCADDAIYARNMITGAIQMDGAILVVSATEGPMPQTAEHMAIARQKGLQHIIVFLNKCDLVDDANLLDLMEMEVRELLSQYDYPGDDTPIIRGSALKALEGDAEWEEKVVELAGIMDDYIPEPTRDTDGPFLLLIEKIYSVPGRGTAVEGRVARGTVKSGDDVEIVGLKATSTSSSVTGVQMFGKTVEEGRAGEVLGVLLRGIVQEELERGQVLAAPGSISSHTTFTAEASFFSKEEGGPSTPLFEAGPPVFYFHTSEITGSMGLPDGVENAIPGETVQVTITLETAMAMEEGTRFAILDDGNTVGTGVVSSLLD